ncbi:MAG: hypothetical protein LBV08_01380 [Clostridiales bacterium]|nr:hypothetical protein [Clostridiales bacterium]
MKKIISYILLFYFILSALPTELLLANRQSPVSKLQISDYTITQQTGYNIMLNWERPTDSNVSDSSAVPGDRSAIHKFEDYEILYRNATKYENYNGVYTTLKSKEQNLVKNLSNVQLLPGSIYAFRVAPNHLHSYIRGSETESRRAPMDYSINGEVEALYLTDISVQAKGVGSELYVTWDNPTYNGMEIFDGYRLYYYQGGPELTTVPNTYYNYVSMSDPNLVRSSDGKLQYVINDTNLKVGKYYSVKVEPVVKGVDLRIAGINNINVGGGAYSIAYRPPSKEYRVNEAYIKPALYLKEEGLDYINLYWDSKKTDLGDILEIRIISSDNPDFNNSRIIGTIYTESVRDVNNWIEERPESKTYYKYIIFYRDPVTGKEMEMESEVVMYDPSVTSFEPYTPHVLQVTDNKEKPLYLDILWEAFLRNPYDSDEKNSLLTGFNKYLDRNIKYDIWITDDINNFDDYAINSFKIDSTHALELEVEGFTGADGVKKAAYHKEYASYAKRLPNGGYEIIPIEENKVYYIRIIGTRDTGEVSNTAIGTYYTPPISDINKQPIMISKPPLRIKKDENGIDVITQNSIAIEWKTRWAEVYDKETNSWYSRVAVDSDGNLIFGDDIKNTMPEERVIDLSSDIYSTSFDQAVNKIKDSMVSLGVANVNELPFREQDLGGASYEISVVKYEEMAEIGYDEYLNSITGDDAKWSTIIPDASGQYPFYNVTGLEENTTYVIFFRPYFMDGDNKKTAYLPNFVIGTTLSARPGIEIKPTVPSIEPVSSTDTSITVRWVYSDELGYDLYVSEDAGNYPEGGIKYPWADIKDAGVIKNENGKKYFYYTIEELFPDTEHLAWLRSFSGSGNGAVYSEFSNPAYITTKDIEAPGPPRGLGLASNNSVNAYNKANGADFSPSAKDYIIIEWLRDIKDTLDGGEGAPPDTAGLAQWLDVPSITNAYLAKFNNLIANNDYFVRVKTRLTITKGEEGKGINRYYSYIAQFADNPDFLDAVEITVPNHEISATGSNVKSKDSDWAVAVKLFTELTTDEYDGDKNPDFYPLAEDDIERIFDERTKTYTMRVRSDGTDADGNKDYFVDQRLISKFVNNNIYDFVLDMENYNDKIIDNRVIKIPYSVFRALEERKINLVVKSEGMKVTIPHNSFSTNALNGFGYGSHLEITIKENPEGLPALSVANGGYLESFASTPQEVTAQIRLPDKVVALTDLSKDLKVQMKLLHRYDTIDNNILAYRHDGNSGGWQLMQSEYDSAEGSVSVSSKRLGSYALIARTVPLPVSNNPYDEYLYSVASKINITDMQNFEYDKPVMPNQFNNILYAIVMGQKSVAMNAELPEQAKNALIKSNMFMGSGKPVNEAAASALVRAYELKTGAAIKDYQNSGLDVAAKSSEGYKVNIQKAYKSGLLEEAIDPKAELTFGEFFYMLDFVLF